MMTYDSLPLYRACCRQLGAPHLISAAYTQLIQLYSQSIYSFPLWLLFLVSPFLLALLLVHLPQLQLVSPSLL
jgi:hypothetical protein